MDLSRVTLGDKILAGAGIALVIDLVILPWRTIFGQGTTAVSPPDAIWGELALLLVLAILVSLAVRRFSTAALPALPVSIGVLTFAATLGVAALLIIKVVVLSDDLGIGAYLGILLAAAMAYGGYLGRDETDEVPPVGSGRGAPPTPF